MTQPFLILKEWSVKCLSHKAHKRNNWRKNSMFSPYGGDETTTPSDRAFRFYPWLYDRKRLMLYFWLCHKKWSMLFSLKLQRNNQQNASAIKPVNGTTEEKTVCSHHTVEMKQPRPLTGPSAFILGCTIGNGWCLIFGCAIKNGRYFFPWSSKGITQKMPQRWIPTTGKLDKKAVFSPCCGGEITTHI